MASMTPTSEPAIHGDETGLQKNEKRQSALLLHGPRERYTLVNNHPIPILDDATEILVQTEVIGLNPIDWKSPDYNFGIPHFPFLAGRELVGTVTKSHAASRFRPGERVIVISTDYRDARKAAYQEFVVAPSYNVVKLPRQLSPDQGAALGVAFVTSALALGSCFGLGFSDVMGGPDLKSVIESVGEDRIPQDVRYEALRSIQDHERALEGDWVAIWGGSATSAYLSIQLARLAGLKVAVIVDQARHGHWLSADSHARPDLLIDNSDPDRAVEVLTATIGDVLHFGIDTNGKESASYLLKALQRRRSSSSSSSKKSPPYHSPSPPPTPPIPAARTERRAHLIGLAGLPKMEHHDDDDDAKDLQMHSVPLKLFHEVPEVGRVLSEWMEVLLQSGKLRAPRILGNHVGLAGVNGALDRMRNGEIRGGKLVVTV
ncbi:hypothetical protein BB8028_0004g01720 [Beauveria bassiana]|uniref:Alcohol dehydrogenase-like N-terminal domain-containing protein n=1 Tax=Beauveria bassiana TaxID=176275 RepID=A0A2S7YAN3_BEABA|nr:hypothetical protein BB8028_0004g01720 [Beauveria bassiana]